MFKRNLMSLVHQNLLLDLIFFNRTQMNKEEHKLDKWFPGLSTYNNLTTVAYQ